MERPESMYLNYRITLIILWLPLVQLYTQNYQLRSYTIEDGLPQSQVYDIAQDHIGYLWLGMQGGGLCRFDGKAFDVWKESDGLKSDYINTITTVNDSLFIGTSNGLSILHASKFYNYDTPQIHKIRNINGNQYIATNEGLFQYTKKQGVIKIKLHPKIDNAMITDIVYDGKLYWITSNKGLWKLSEVKADARIFDRHSAYQFNAAIFNNDKVYAASVNQGILILNTNAKSYGNKWIKNSQKVNQLTIVNDSELWGATDDRGIIIINIPSKKISSTITRRDGLKVSQVRRTMVDNQSNIWIATSGGGFYKYYQNSFIHFTKNNGLKEDRTYALHAVGHQIWASNAEEGLITIDSLGIKHIPQHPKASGVKIRTIKSDTLQNLWIGTEGKGIVFKKRYVTDSIVRDTIRKSRNRIHKINIDTVPKISYVDHLITRKKGLLSNRIVSLVVDNNTIWAASYAKGITKFRYNSRRKRLLGVRKFALKSGIKDLRINHITKDSSNVLWYGTRNGHLGCIKKNKVIHIGNVLKRKTAIRSIVIQNNTMYLGTGGRGIWWSKIYENPKDFVFKKLIGQKKLYSQNIYQLIFDGKGNLWAGSEKGVDKIILNANEPTILDTFHFGRNDGFLGIETCMNAVTKDPNDNLWFGTIYGLTKYQPSFETTRNAIKPQLFFENIEIAYQPIDTIAINQWIKHKKVLELTPEQTELSFNFKTIDLDHPSDLQYRWKLNTSEWSPWSANAQQNFAGLAYGSHAFTAQARNFRWQESDPKTFLFLIDSPLYKKIWFQASFLILSITLLSLYGWSVIKKVKKKNAAEQERLKMQNHLLTLEQKALRLQMNPHFIFNVLNGIKAMGNRDIKRMNTTINTFATLLRETLYNSRKDTITLDQEIKTLENYIKIEKLMSSKVFEHTLTVDTDPDPEEILIPPMLIQPFVENAVRHGILKSPRDGMLKIDFQTTQDFLHCSIEDNGPGIFHSQKTKAKTDHQSVALKVTEDRLESISGKNALKFEEVTDSKNEVQGTKK